MKSRLIIPGLLVTAGLTVALWVADAGRGHAQEGCPTGQVCNPAPCESIDSILALQPTSNDCTTEVAVFTPTMDTWNYVFDANNAIKIGTDVSCPFALQVDKIRISQSDYATMRRDPQFADTICNPTFAPPGPDCVFYRAHGESVPRECYGATVEYKIFWNNPPIQGNKHDWMLLRAPCDEFMGDTAHPHCFENPPFSENVTLFVDRKPPVGTDPVVGGGGDGISDFIVAISTKHPHKGFPPLIIFP